MFINRHCAMATSNKSCRRRWLLIGIVVVALAVSMIWFAIIKTTVSATPSRVVFSADSNGTARLLGVSLANTNVRDGVFKVMGAAGMKAAIAVPAGLSPTNQAQVSNFIQTLEAMGRAGLFPTNSTPNPYE